VDGVRNVWKFLEILLHAFQECGFVAARNADGDAIASIVRLVEGLHIIERDLAQAVEAAS